MGAEEQKGEGVQEYEGEGEHGSGHGSGHESDEGSDEDEEDESNEDLAGCFGSCLPPASPALLADAGGRPGPLSHEVDGAVGEREGGEENRVTSTPTGDADGTAYYCYRSTTGRWLLADQRADVNAGNCQLRSTKTSASLPNARGLKWQYFGPSGEFMTGKEGNLFIISI